MLLFFHAYILWHVKLTCEKVPLLSRRDEKELCTRDNGTRAMPHLHPPSTTCACPFSVPVHVMRSSRTFVGKWNFKCDWWKCKFCVTLIFYAADVCIYSTAYLLLYFVVTKRMCAADIKFSFYWRAKKGLLTFLWCHLLVLRARKYFDKHFYMSISMSLRHIFPLFKNW